MRAATIAGSRLLSIDTVPVPELRPDSALVRIQGCGLCGSNLPVWQGRPWFQYPLPPGAPGHEGWGIVEAVGEQVGDVEPGVRVGLLSYNAFAEFDVTEARRIAVIPDALSEEPFPGEALACAVNVFRRSSIQAGETVVVLGVGFLGGLLVCLAASAGARVIAVSRRSFALDVARRMGATDGVLWEVSRPLAAHILNLTEGRGCDCLIEATGAQAALDVAGDAVRERGRIVIAGYHQDGLRQINLQVWNWKGLDVINAHERDPSLYVEGMRVAIDLIMSGALNPAPLYTHRVPLREISTAFEYMESRPEGFLKALIIP